VGARCPRIKDFLQTDLMKKDGLVTRFDTDAFFGTALNRFVKQAIDGEPITVYGRGQQQKPFISLEDCVHSIINAIDYPVKGHEIMNQVTDNVSIDDLAHMINLATDCKIEHIENPRKEKEDFKMKFDNKGFLKLLGRKPKKMVDEIRSMICWLTKPKISDTTTSTFTFTYA